MPSTYDYSLISLSVLIAIFAAFVAISLSGRILMAQGLRRRLWIVGGASAMGLGIFSMHHVGLLAFTLPISVVYDLPALLLSLLAAVVAAGVGLAVSSGPELGVTRLVVGSAVMGLGFSVMHYVGIDAMRLRAIYSWTAGVMAASIAIRIAASMVDSPGRCIGAAGGQRFKSASTGACSLPDRRPLATAVSASGIGAEFTYS